MDDIKFNEDIGKKDVYKHFESGEKKGPYQERTSSDGRGPSYNRSQTRCIGRL